MGKLDSKIAIVTGAASGLGKAIALLFAREGADIAIIDLKAEAAEAVAREARDLGRRSLAVVADVAEEASVSQAMDRVFRDLGEPDILVNNAGIDTTSIVEEMPTAMWDEMIRVNLRSVFLCTRAVLPAMRRKGYGRIINISSQLAHKGGAEMAHYAAAKAGILGFTRSLSYEVAKDNITANAICPGPLDTELYQQLPEDWKRKKMSELIIGRPGRVEEVAPTALLLASEDGGFYIGATLNPNGGDIMV
ncbi:MAG TPA: SDR family NAD(P)-dependent oxidoreductase [Geminicoccaceae bacterium]|nr:SDR family NAD(P)-dependent oxidoreductase [Geminicoccaceae bacterium]